ncbi:class I SAM-dependent methyltransferase [Salinarimonas rosea]|uniref:class I SAM-dependent methyltransferase n=1 Tax=Salinarimonas rosea TaxID=552063 RepID=UPI0004176691|nr:class I SAM-dependent methyltransferase [Salinarimonas rosea]
MTAYDAFLADIYDHSPYFCQGRTRELDRFNAPYFRHLEGRSKSVLEFGSGTGMLTIPLATRGYGVTSVDNSPDMHDVLGAKLRDVEPQVAGRVEQVLADALTYRAPEPAETIVMPEGILIALPDRALQRALLESCHRNLAPGGRLMTDFFQPRFDLVHRDELTEFTRFRTPDGRAYLMTMRLRNDRYTQVQHWTATYAELAGGETVREVVVEVPFRYLTASEIELLLELCGFRVVELDTEYADRRGFFLVAEKT